MEEYSNMTGNKTRNASEVMSGFREGFKFKFVGVNHHSLRGSAPSIQAEDGHCQEHADANAGSCVQTCHPVMRRFLLLKL